MSDETLHTSCDKLKQHINKDEVANHHEILDALQEFNPHKNKKVYAKDIIYRKGDDSEYTYIVLDGMVKLLVYLPNGKARIVRLHGTGHWFGIEGIGKGQPYEHTAVAVSDVNLICLPTNKFHQLEMKNPKLYCEVIKRGYEHLEQADKWIADFSTGNIKSRLARLINFLSDLEYGESSNHIDLLTVNEMADILGVTQESVSRFLAEFKRNQTLRKTDDETHYNQEKYTIDLNKLDTEEQK